jgi:hypothetical protein
MFPIIWEAGTAQNVSSRYGNCRPCHRYLDELHSHDKPILAVHGRKMGVDDAGTVLASHKLQPWRDDTSRVQPNRPPDDKLCSVVYLGTRCLGGESKRRYKWILLKPQRQMHPNST